MKSNSDLYLGRHYDLAEGEILDDAVGYDPDDLTTHGVVVGMTGSGKTGLSVGLLEELALQGIPALLVDPKGDLTNLLLHFPSLAPEDFEPWVDAGEARREGKSPGELATEEAQNWRAGLQQWDIEPERIEAVRQAVAYAVFTPGSEAGRPVDVLTALSAPEGDWQDDPDRFRDKITTTATALLGLVEIEADPVQSREHILLANLLEAAWQAGEGLDLVELIHQVQNPPFHRLGALEVDQFFPEKDRFELATTLNNLLAAPSFGAWTVGEPLDIERMLWTAGGRPRQTVFYLAHLAETERMFFVTLLLGALEAWMRGQSGATGLRALFYMDEVLGYLPPTAVPPSKPTFLRLLKQARAFGLGLLLATQNPVDLDYKALSNAGTWFVGRLQTEQDKARLLDGLEGATGGEGGFDRKQADETLGKLKKRTFLLHNIHEPQPLVFYTRWAMAYLAGPITLDRIEALNKLIGARSAVEAPAQGGPATAEAPSGDWTSSRPSLPGSIVERFLAVHGPQGKGERDLVYRPALLAQGTVRFVDHDEGVDARKVVTALTADPDERGMVAWTEVLVEELQGDRLAESPVEEARFEAPSSPLNDDKLMRQLEKDFSDFLYRTEELHLPANPELDLVASPEETESQFQARCLEAATKLRDEEAEELKEDYQKKIESLKKKLSKEERELAEEMAELSSRRMEEWVTHAENLLGFLGGSRSRRRVSTSLRKRRMTGSARADVEESEERIGEFNQDLEDLEVELREALEELDEHWVALSEEREEAVLTPRRKDVHVDLFGVLWLPHWQTASGGLRAAYSQRDMGPD